MRVPLVLFAIALLIVASICGESHGANEESLEEIHEALLGPWTRVRTPHFRVHSDHPTPLDSYQLELLERSFEQIADGLGIPDSVRRGLRVDPIEFYYTRSHSLLSRLGGRDAEGLAFAQHKVIVSLRLPHAHEVAHVLLQLASRARAAQSAPLLQEGLATWWGGTAEAARSVVLENGREALLQGRASLEDLLTPAGLSDSAADSHDLYALAALFCEYARERHSMPVLLQLLARLSDDAESLEVRPAQATVVQFEGLEGKDWPEVVAGFRGWAQEHSFGGIVEGPVPPVPPQGERSEQDHALQWWVVGGELVVRIATEGERAVDAELLWGDLLPERGDVDRGQPRWRRWGLRVSPEEVVLADHRARRQLARLASGGRARSDTADMDDRDPMDDRIRTIRVDLSAVPEVGPPRDFEFFVSPVVHLPAMAEPGAHRRR